MTPSIFGSSGVDTHVQRGFQGPTEDTWLLRICWRKYFLFYLPFVFPATVRDNVVKYAIQLGIFGAFQIGELVAQSTILQGRMLVWNVQLHNRVLQLLLPRSKTDQGGRSCLIVLHRHASSLTFPVHCFELFMTTRPFIAGRYQFINQVPLSLFFSFGNCCNEYRRI